MLMKEYDGQCPDMSVIQGYLTWRSKRIAFISLSPAFMEIDGGGDDDKVRLEELETVRLLEN